MPDLLMSKTVRRRELGSTRPFDLFNMFPEKDDTAPGGYCLQSRTGLVVNSTLGSGPINGMFTELDVFSSALFAISAGVLYKDTTSLGAIAGSGAASFAASRIEIALTRGTTAYSYNGTNLAAIALPASFAPVATAYLGGYFIFVRSDGRFYWSASQDARTVDALDFANAESAPDGTLDAYVVNDGLWFMGRKTVEFWQLTGDADAPFARGEGMLLKKGIIATGAATDADNTLFWWGHDNAIYLGSEGVPQRVSDDAIDEKLEGSTLKDMFSFTYKGHVFVGVRTDTGSHFYDVGMSQFFGQPIWCEFGTYGRIGWRAASAAVVNGVLLLGDDTNSTLWRFANDNWDDGEYLERRFTSVFPPGVTPITVHKLCVECNSGATGLLTGQGSDPVMEIRASLDAGKTWGGFRQAKLGPQGRYRQRVEKRRWGLFSDKGGLFDHRVTDPVPLRVTRVYANEPGGGRGTGQNA